MIFTWNIADPVGNQVNDELVVGFDRGRAVRVLVLPAWFDEANKLRRFTVEVMRRLDIAGIDSLLPDLPGCNESLEPLEQQTLAGWRKAAETAARVLGATHVLAIRAGALVAPDALPGWRYAAQSGPKLLRNMIRARTIAAREAGIVETFEGLSAIGRKAGLLLSGWSLGPEIISELESAEPTLASCQSDIAQNTLGGPGLWLRAEPDEDAGQADRIAQFIAQNTAKTAG